MKKIKLLSIISICIFSWNVNGQISGNVYRDFNANGVKDNSATFVEIGVGGVSVKAYNASGTQVGSVTTATDGSYSFIGLTLPVRLEFIPVLVQDYDGSNGAQSSTSVQFYSAASTNANYGLNYPANFCQSNPDLITPIYVNGRPTTPEATTKTFEKHPYNATGESTASTFLADATEIGSTWGVAYDKNNQLIYTAAFVKRHVALKDNNGDGKEDIGAIYSMSVTGSPSLWLDFTTLANVGLSLMPTIATRDLPLSQWDPSYDSALFDLVGKIGLGDLEISDDNKLLYVVNLYDQKIYTIDIATKTLVGNGIAVPSTCSGGISRPFGLKFHRGKLYVGAICDATTSNNTNDLKANVYRLDGGTFTNILNFPLTYTKGYTDKDVFPGTNLYGTLWQPWRNSFYPVPSGSISKLFIYPQPVFADIEFDVNEAIIMTFNDRTAHQTGYNNYGTNQADPITQYSGFNSGDILRASLINGNYVLENNASSNGITTAGANNGQGPGGGEYYFQDLHGDSFGDYHQETVMGGSSMLSGSGQVAINVMNPINSYSGGTTLMNNTTGFVDADYEIYSGPVHFGKAAGLGDLELLCNPAPIEIGNRVWMDTDNDGVQDADEMGLDGIPVKLYSGATLVATKSTTNGGQYYFGTIDGVLPNTTYTIRIEAASIPSGKFVTLKDQPTGGVQDLGDNDASLVGVNADITYTTGNAGENNHTLDFGFSATPLATCLQDSIKICSGQSVELVGFDGFTNYKWYIINAPGDTVEVASGQTFTTATVGNYIYKAIDGSGCPVSLCCPVTVADSTCCVINNLNLVIGNCDNKGTLTNASDDEYTFILNPTGNGIGTTYTVSGLPNSPQTGTYGSPTTFGPYLISVGVLNITVVDNVSNTCSKTASVSPPPSCSVCNVSSPVLAINDNICPSRTGTINLVQDCGAGTFIQYSINNGTFWSTVKPLYSTTPRTILARCVNSTDTTCKSPNTTVTTAPKKCPTDGSECSLIANATIDPCNNNGTDNLSTDDYFTIQVSATVANGGSSNKYEVVIGADHLTGIGGNVLNSGGTNYGSPVTIGNTKIFLADGTSTYQLVIRDINNNNCFQIINIDPVASCSNAPPKSPCYPVPCVPIGLIKN